MMNVSMDYDKRAEKHNEKEYADYPWFAESRHLVLTQRGAEALNLLEPIKSQIPHAKFVAQADPADEWRHTNRQLTFDNISEIVEGWSYWIPPSKLHGLLEFTKDGEAIVFVTVEDAISNNRTTMKMGKYLRKVLPDRPDEWYAKRVLETKALLDTEEERYKVHFSEDADEAEWAYENGPSSCMKHVDADIHPARVYCVDLKVAYIMSLDKQRCIARCVVYPDEMLMACVYGNDVLTNKLDEMGYNTGSGWTGARLDYITDHNDKVICPYLDTYETYVEEDSGYLVISNSAYECANQTTGYLHSDLEECACCGYEAEEDELSRVSGGDRVCGSCLDGDYRYVPSTHDYHREVDVYWCEDSEEYELC